MKKKSKFVLIAILMILTGFLIAYPFIKIYTGNTLIICNYNGDFSKFDKNHSYNELYCYDEERDISINSFDVKNFLFFYTVSMNYIEGDFRKTQFVLKESYIENFLNNAEIISNDNNIQLASLIEGKTAVVGNTRYVGNDYNNGIFYKLDGRHEEMYVFNVDDLLVIQVGSPDELPRYIAYK